MPCVLSGPRALPSSELWDGCGPHSWILSLARIGQSKAALAGEETTCPVKLCNPPATELSFTLTGAIEPSPLAAEMALGPVDRNCLCRKIFDAVNETRMKSDENVKLGD